MGILEGRWLATVDEDPHQPGTVNLLTGHIEAALARSRSGIPWGKGGALLLSQDPDVYGEE